MNVTRPDPGFCRRFAAVGGLAAAAAIVALFMYASGLAARLEALRGDLVAERERARFLAAPETHVIDLVGTAEAPRARAKLAYDRKSGRAILFGYDLPRPPDGKAYQLWSFACGKPLPGLVFAPEPSGNGSWNETIPPAGCEPAVFAVTLEPARGIAAPSGPTILEGRARS